MSRETLLDEAIAKAKEVEDWQLVEWLRMARGSESAVRWYTAKLSEARLDISKLMTENAKLRELVKEAHLCMVNEGCCEDCYATHGECPIEMDMRELGIEVPD